MAEAGQRRIDLSLAGIAARVLDDTTAQAESRGRSDAARVVRVSGPLVEIDAAAPLAMYELVTLGPSESRARWSRSAEQVTVQAYEYTGGLGPGAGVVARRPVVGVTGTRAAGRGVRRVAAPAAHRADLVGARP